MDEKQCRAIAVAAAKDLFKQIVDPIDLLKFLAFESDQMHHFIVEGKIKDKHAHYFFIRVMTDIVASWLERPENPIELVADGFEELYQAGHYEWYTSGMEAMMKMLAEIGHDFPETYKHIGCLYALERHLLKYHEAYQSKNLNDEKR